MPDTTRNQIEPYPTDGEERDHEAAKREMGLGYRAAFKIGSNAFEYRGIDLGEAVVDRLTEPRLSHCEKIPMTELWESYQRGNLELGKWRCRFIATNDPTADDE
jgi:hypothetical protein